MDEVRVSLTGAFCDWQETDGSKLEYRLSQKCLRDSSPQVDFNCADRRGLGHPAECVIDGKHTQEAGIAHCIGLELY